jgi:hypothetical protein
LDDQRSADESRSEITISDSVFSDNVFSQSMLSVIGAFRAIILDCVFRRGLSYHSSSSAHSIYIDADRLLVSGVLLSDAGLEEVNKPGTRSSGIAIIMTAKAATIANLHFEDAYLPFPASLFTLNLVPSLDQNHEDPLFTLDNVTFDRVRMEHPLSRTQQLMSINQASGVGRLPPIALKGITFRNIHYSRIPSAFGQTSLLSALNLRDLKLSRLRVHNVSTGDVQIDRELNGEEAGGGDEGGGEGGGGPQGPLDTHLVFANFGQMENLEIEHVHATHSNGGLEISGITGLLTISNVTMSVVQIPNAIHISNFAEATLFDIYIDNLLGVALRSTRGSQLWIENFRAASCRHPLDDGAAIHITYTDNVSIEKSSFKNSLSSTGGAIFVWGGSSVNLVGCDFDRNEAMAGGAIMVQATALTMMNNSFTFNRATGGNGGAIFAATQRWSSTGDNFWYNEASADGGAIGFLFSPQNAKEPLSLEIAILETGFIGNQAGQNGGAIAIPSTTSISREPDDFELLVSIVRSRAVLNRASITPFTRQPSPPPIRFYLIPNLVDSTNLGGFWLSPYPSSFLVTGGEFISNSAQYGGVFFFTEVLSDRADFEITDSRFTDNYAFGGGVIHSVPSAPGFQREVFSGNLVMGNVATYGAFIVVIFGPTHIFLNQNSSGSPRAINHFSGNSASAGGVLFLAYPLEYGETQFVNQDFSGNTAEMGAIVCYSQIEKFSLLSSPCQPPNVCRSNMAFGFGPERATLHRRLVLDRNPGNRLRAYSALMSISGVVFDDYGQHFADRSRYSLSMKLEPLQGAREASNSLFSNQSMSSHALSTQPELSGSNTDFESFIYNGIAEVNFLVLYPSTEPMNVTLTIFRDIMVSASLDLELGGCPIGMRFEPVFGCVRCPLGTFSLTHDISCISCPLSQHLSCFNGEPLSSRGYYVVVAENRTALVPVACPFPDRCLGGFNQCSSGRQGFLCSSCAKGRHESWTSTCTICKRLNWPLLILAIVGLWIVTLVLHSLISRSSGKATILIYFLQTSYFLVSDLPLSPFFNALSGRSNSALSSSSRGSSLMDLLGFFLCLAPMDIFWRQLLFASIPLIMGLQFVFTFAIYHLFIFLIRRINNYHRGSAAGKTESEWLGFGSEDEDVVILSDQEQTHDNLSDLSGVSLEPITQVINMEIYEENENRGFDQISEQDRSTLGYESIQIEDERSEISSSSDLDSIKANDEGDGFVDPKATTSSNLLMDVSHDDMRRMSKQTRFFHHYRLIRTLVYLFAQTFSSVLGFIMIFTDCRSVPNLPRDPYMAKSPSESCTSDKYRRWRLSLIFTVPWVVLVLGFVSYRLFYGRMKGLLSNQDVRFGVLYEMFRSKFFFWKLFELARRLLLALPFLPNSTTSSRGNLYAAIMMLMFVAQIVARPYAQQLENRLAAGTLAALILIAFLTSWNPHDNAKLTIAIPGAILAIVALVVILTLIALLRTKLVNFRLPLKNM